MYYPPDYDPKYGGLNKFQGTHALRERAKKIDQGILIIRFEMPYNIWCEGCNNHVGMGVRYNAEKKKVGMYYTTPVYQFKMKCHLCDNYYEIKTDPGKLDYEIVSGARRQENRWDPTENGQIVPEDKEVQKRLFDDPMFKLEHKATDQKGAEDAKPVLGKLYLRNQDVWSDPYTTNQKLRATFRKRKAELKEIQDKDDLLLKKSSLNIALLPESEQDRKLAALMNLQSRNINEVEKEKKAKIMEASVFGGCSGGKVGKVLKQKLNRADLGIAVTKGSSTEQECLPSSSKQDVVSDKVLSPGHNVSSLSLVQSYSSSENDEEDDD